VEDSEILFYTKQHMCGIFAYRGNKPAVRILEHGLQRLEYRGYDSAGVALMQET